MVMPSELTRVGRAGAGAGRSHVKVAMVGGGGVLVGEWFPTLDATT